MTNRIVISESQYGRLFLGEQKEYTPDCPPIKHPWRSSNEIPYDWVADNPFKDGYDYKYKAGVDCKRRWVRKSIKNKSNGWFLYGDGSGIDGEAAWVEYRGKKMVVPKDSSSNLGKLYINKGDSIPDGYKPFYSQYIQGIGSGTDGDKELTKKLYTYVDKVQKQIYDKSESLNREMDTLDYKEGVFREGNEILKGWGWSTIDDGNKGDYMFMEAEDIQRRMINTVGYRYLVEIERIKSNNMLSYDGCRMVWFYTLGSVPKDVGNQGGVLIETMESDGLISKNNSRSYLPSTANLPWMCYFTMGQLYHNGNMPNGKWNPEEVSRVIGEQTYFQWFQNVYGTGDINKIKNMVIKGVTTKFRCEKPKWPSWNQIKEKRVGVKDIKLPDPLDAFGEWVDSWDAQDWIDVTSIVLYLIPTPVTWALATALEIGNAGISYGKGNKGDAAIRAGFLVGGALLSKVLSSTYKASKESAEELVAVLNKAKGRTPKEITKIISDARLNMTSGGRKLLDDITYQVGEGSTELVEFATKNNEFMITVQHLIDVEKLSEKRAVQSALKRTFGENMYHKIWKHVAPTTVGESVSMAVLYGFMQFYSYIKFKEALIKKGATEENANLYLSKMIGEYLQPDPSDKEVKELLTNTKEFWNEWEKLNDINTLPIYDNFTNNCTQGFEGVTDEKLNQDITSGGVSVKAGGNYDYKIYPDLTSENSWVYTKGSSEVNWRKGNCKTAEKVFKSYCKNNDADLDTVLGRSCSNMLGGEEWEKGLSYVEHKLKNKGEKVTVVDMDKISDGILDMFVDYE